MSTPENRIKHLINQILSTLPNLYRFMPVPSGYGATTIDYLCCYKGHFFGIEAKAPGKVPTPRQDYVLEQIRLAGVYHLRDRWGARPRCVAHVPGVESRDETMNANTPVTHTFIANGGQHVAVPTARRWQRSCAHAKAFDRRGRGCSCCRTSPRRPRSPATWACRSPAPS